MNSHTPINFINYDRLLTIIWPGTRTHEIGIKFDLKLGFGGRASKALNVKAREICPFKYRPHRMASVECSFDERIKALIKFAIYLIWLYSFVNCTMDFSWRSRNSAFRWLSLLFDILHIQRSMSWWQRSTRRHHQPMLLMINAAQMLIRNIRITCIFAPLGPSICISFNGYVINNGEPFSLVFVAIVSHFFTSFCSVFIDSFTQYLHCTVSTYLLKNHVVAVIPVNWIFV